jgi:hypothetical protein
LVNQLKALKWLSSLLGNKTWVERSTRASELADFLKSLKPIAPQRGLIRVGGKGDGGYLIPDDLDGISHSISPGVAGEISFDLALAQRGIQVLMFDASVNGPPENHANFKFTKKFLDFHDSENTVRLDTVCQSCPHNAKDMFLQMDIEGAEWRVIMDTPIETLRKFRVMVIEFHGLNRLFGRAGFFHITPVFQKLMLSHNIVHIHPNNCADIEWCGNTGIPPVVEFTFLRRDRDFAVERSMTIPHSLDKDCVAERKSIALPKWW